jgi:tetratricopeptide (TPR) repeat protein
MGLLEEAIAEFEVALRHGGGTRAADCHTMLGVCELERGNSKPAVAHFQKGLELPDLAAPARHALQFELGAALEADGRNSDAVEQYQAVFAEDASFRDVSARIQRLGGSLEVKARPIVKPGALPARKAAAQATAAPVAAARSPSPSTEPPRKNRKIGFV